MTLAHKSSSLSLRQRLLPRRDSSPALRENSNPESANIPKWNIAQRIRHRRSAHALSEKRSINDISQAASQSIPAVPAIPSNLKHFNQQPNNNQLFSPSEQPVRSGIENAQIQSGWPLPLNDALASGRSQASYMDQDHSFRPMSRDGPRVDGQSRNKYALRLNPQPSMPFRPIQQQQNSTNSWASDSPPSTASSGPSTRPMTGVSQSQSHSNNAQQNYQHRLRNSRSVGHNLYSSQSVKTGSTSVSTFEQESIEYEREAEFAGFKPSTESKVNSKAGKRGSIWQRVKSGLWSGKKANSQPQQPSLRHQQSTQDAAALRENRYYGHHHTGSSGSSAVSQTFLSRKEQQKQVKLSKRVSNLEAKLREAKAQLNMLEQDLDEVDDENEPVGAYQPGYHQAQESPSHSVVDHEKSRNISPLMVANPEPDSPVDSSSSPSESSFSSISSRSLSTDPSDDLPVDEPNSHQIHNMNNDDMDNSYGFVLDPRTLSTVIEVASQEGTPAAARVESPLSLTAAVAPLQLQQADSEVEEEFDSTTDTEAPVPVPSPLFSVTNRRRAARSMSPVKAPFYEQDIDFRMSKQEIAEQVVSAALGPRITTHRRTRSETVGPISVTRSTSPIKLLPPELYFLPSTTYSPSRAEEKKRRSKSSNESESDSEGDSEATYDIVPVEAPPRSASSGGSRSAGRPLPDTTNAANARARALEAASALPQTLVSPRRPIGPGLPIIPHHTRLGNSLDLPDRPPPLRRPCSLPSVSAAAISTRRRGAPVNLAAVIVPEERETLDSDVETSSRRGFGTGMPFRFEEEEEDEENNSALASAFRSPSSFLANRSILSPLTPAERNVVVPQPESMPTPRMLPETGTLDRNFRFGRNADENRAPSRGGKSVTADGKIAIRSNEDTITISFPSSFTAPAPTTTRSRSHTRANKSRTRALSMPAPRLNLQPSSRIASEGPEAPRNKPVFTITLPSPTATDKENYNAVIAAELANIARREHAVPAARTGAVASGSAPSPDNGSNTVTEEDDNNRPQKSSRGNGSCRSSQADLDGSSSRRRFPPGGSGIPIESGGEAESSETPQEPSKEPEEPARSAASVAHSSSDSPARAVLGESDMPSQSVRQPRQRDSKVQTLVANRASTADRNSTQNRVGNRRRPDEWVWPDDVF